MLINFSFIFNHITWLLSVVITVRGFIKPYDDGCHWKWDLVDSQTLASENNMNPIKPLTDVTLILNQTMTVDFLNDKHTVQNESFSIFPYYLRVNIRCQGREDETEIVNMGLANSHPRVAMRLTIVDPATLCTQRRILIDLEGVLVQITDPAQLMGKNVTDPTAIYGVDLATPDRFKFDDKLYTKYPYAIWLVPVPMLSSMTAIDIAIKSPRVGMQRKEEHFILYFDYFKTNNDTATVVHFDMAATPVPPTAAFSGPATRSRSKFGTANAMPLPLLVDTADSDTLIYTPDGGKSFYRYKFAAPSGSALICTGETTFKILSYGVFPYRVLLGTTYGLMQVMSRDGMQKYPTLPKTAIIRTDCVKTIVAPQVNNVKGAFVTLITDKAVLQSPFFTPTGDFNFTTSFLLTDACTAIKTNITSLVSADVIGLCDFTIAFEVSKNSSMFAVKLLGGDGSDLTKQQSCIVTFNSINSTWQAKSCLPRYLPSVTDLSMPYVTVSGSAPTTNPYAHITGIEHRDTGAMEYYAYGSGLFFSNDGGSTWIYFYQFGVSSGSTLKSRIIKKIDYSMVATRYVALTVEVTKSDNSKYNEIWVGHWGQPTLYNLYPTPEWELCQLLLPYDNLDYQAWQTAGQTAGNRFELGVFFDSLGNLQQIFAFKDAQNSWSFKALRFPVDELIPAVYSSKIDVFTDTITAGLPVSSNECPALTVKVQNRQAVERLEYYRFLKPQTRQEDYFQMPDVATVYSATVHALGAYCDKDFTSNYTSTPSGYSEQVSQYFANGPYPQKWQFEKLVARMDSRRILVLAEDYQDLIVDDQNVIFSSFPDHIYIDRFGNFTVIVSLYNVYPTGGFGLTEIAGLPKVGFHMVNGSLLQGSMVTTYFPDNHLAEYKITFTESGTLPQVRPGGQQISDTISIMIPQSIDCYPNKPVYEATVHVGCRPSLQMQFDWQLLANQSSRTFFDCNDPVPNMPCVDYLQNPPIFLRLVDHATNLGLNYTGKYRLYVVGFSLGKPADIKRFSDDEITRYNSASNDGDSQSTIWIPTDTPGTNESDADFRILDITRNTIQFICQADSPCGNLPIGITDEPHLNFLIRVTNQDLPDTGTYCLFDLEFVVRIRGAAPNPNTVHVPVFVGTLAVIFFLSFCYVRLFMWRFYNEKAFRAHLRKQRELAHEGISQETFGNNVKGSYGGASHGRHTKTSRVTAYRPHSVATGAR